MEGSDEASREDLTLSGFSDGNDDRLAAAESLSNFCFLLAITDALASWIALSSASFFSISIDALCRARRSSSLSRTLKASPSLPFFTVSVDSGNLYWEESNSWVSRPSYCCIKMSGSSSPSLSSSCSPSLSSTPSALLSSSQASESTLPSLSSLTLPALMGSFLLKHGPF